VLACRLRQPLVVDEERAEVVAHAQRSGEVDGVERPKCGRIELCRRLDDPVIDGKQREASECDARAFLVLRPVAPAGPNRLDRNQRARDA
jgi:hypothetical protein